MKTLSELIGEEVIISIAFLPPNKPEVVTLHGVENGGIWIGSESMTQTMLDGLQIPAGRTPIAFLPFVQIRYVLGALDGISLSNKAFGV
jgi:hypothetical protein